MMIKVLIEIIVELKIIQKQYIGSTKPKIKNKTISSDFKGNYGNGMEINSPKTY